jgi:MFS transporter, CP family, cyanate transporter
LSTTPAGSAAGKNEGRTAWVALLAVLGGGMAAGMNVGKVPVALPQLRAELGLTLVQAGWVSSMLTTVAVFSAAFVGMWVGRIGALRMVCGGLGLGALASAATTLLPSAQALLLWRFVEGAGFMAVAVASPALVTAASASTHRRFALGLWSAYMPAGAGVAMALAPLLLPVPGWRGLWWLTSAVLLAAASGVWSQREKFGGEIARGPSAASAVSFFGPIRQALAQPLPWLLAASFGAWATQHFALIIWMPTYMIEQRALGAGKVALLTGLMLVACVPGNLLGGVLVQRGVPRGALLAATQAVTGLCGFGFFDEAWPDGLRYGLCVLMSFVGGMIPAAVMASSTVLARTPQQIGTLQGLYTQGAQLGQFVGTPLIAATVAASGHWSAALGVTAGAALIGVALGLVAQCLESRLGRAHR